MLQRDVYLQPDAPDPVLDERRVLMLARRHVPGAQAVTSVDESGGEARAYLVDDSIIVKTQRPHRLRPRTSLAKEAFFLEHLAAFPDIPVPRVLGYGRDGPTEYICMTRMPGVAARSVALEGEPRTRLLYQLGRTLRLIHGVPQAPLHRSPLFPGPRSAQELAQRLAAGFSEAVAALTADPARWPFAVAPAQVATAALAALPASLPVVTLHSNPGPEHVFVDPQTLELAGIIDFGDAYTGHPAFDWRWPRFEDQLAILTGYQQGHAPLGEDFVVAWRSVQVFAEMTALVARPERRARAVEHLARLTDDLFGQQ